MRIVVSGTQFELLNPDVKYLIMLFLICCLPFAASGNTPDTSRPNGRLVLTGRVLDEAGSPVPGASIALRGDTLTAIGVATDEFGRFTLHLPSGNPVAPLRVSSVGFLTRSFDLDFNGHDSLAVCITLEAATIELGVMAVVPRPEVRAAGLTLSAHRVSTRARQSLVPTNPVGAIRNVDVARAGSNHSSQLRIHGTSPEYYMNGVSIGTDPDHYGMFTILPSTVIDRVELQALGTSAEHPASSIVQLHSPERFGKNRTLDFNLSTVEATGTYGVGTEQAFVLGTLRKSVLDKLVNYFEVSDNRRTLPPTNFQDIAIVSGWKPHRATKLLFDQYHTNDYLTYRVESNRADGDVETWQHTSEHFLSLRMQHLFDRALVEVSVAMTRAYESYGASPEDNHDSDRLHLDLSQEHKAMLFSSMVDLQHGQNHVRAGTQTTWITNRTITLEQNNWNFLPPFASSDNPYIYQPALNYSYAGYRDRDQETSHAVFATVERPVGPVTVEAGLRGEYFTALAAPSALLVRTAVTVPYGADCSVRLYAGTFAEHPVGRILEPYQVVIHDQLGQLTPVKTRLVSATLAHGPVTVTAFDKKIANLPALMPNFDLQFEKIDPGDQDIDLLFMGSTGSAQYRGLSFSYEQDAVLHSAFNLSLGYAYTAAVKYDYGVQMPPDLHSPHRFITHVEYKPSAGVMVGTEFSVRSGYPYSQSREAKESFTQEDLTPDWYRSQLALENQERFPSSVSLNFFFSVALPAGEVYGSIANVTNRENPIINTSSGYISDSGILPTVGVRFRF
jgi:hypothetical protein